MNRMSAAPVSRACEASRAPATVTFVRIPLLVAAAACVAHVPLVGAKRDARVALERFSAAVERGRWGEAYPLLSARWRARETPSRLASDFAESGAVGQNAVRRVRVLLDAGVELSTRNDEAILAVGADRSARLVREDGRWRVEALE